MNLIRPLISRITRITHHSVCVYLRMKAFGTAGSEGAATRHIRAIRAIRVQEKTHHTRIIYPTTNLTDYTNYASLRSRLPPDESKSAATCHIRAIRALRVQEKNTS